MIKEIVLGVTSDDGSSNLVVAHSSIPKPKMLITLRVDELYKIIKSAPRGSFLNLEFWSDYNDECNDQKYYRRVSLSYNDKEHEDKLIK